MQTPLLSAQARWIPTRAQALRRLAGFIPRAGRTYAAQRNNDWGPGDRANVSTLSPYLRHRIITESEVLAAVLGRHSLTAADKFVQEVFWRTYWKGWLETHPSAWSRYRAALAQQIRDVEEQPEYGRSYQAAIDGRTGIDAFDTWAHELVEQNYLHNHARMWFASIWIFTLHLPWELGADFFMQHLLDGDQASNTLSWRWVAGLHTRGRTYLATRDNIRRYTAERFDPGNALARSAAALVDEPIPLADPMAITLATTLETEASLFVIHDDDLHGDHHDFPPGMRAAIAFRATAGRSPQAVSAAVHDFSAELSREALRAIATATGAVNLGLHDSVDADAIGAAIADAARSCGATRIVCAFAPVGPARDVLATVRAVTTAQGFSYAQTGRRYDAVAWPAATRGFFNLRSRIPTIVAELGIGAG